MNSGCFTSEFAKHMTNKYCLCLSTYVSAFGFVGFILFFLRIPINFASANVRNRKPFNSDHFEYPMLGFTIAVTERVDSLGCLGFCRLLLFFVHNQNCHRLAYNKTLSPKNSPCWSCCCTIQPKMRMNMDELYGLYRSCELTTWFACRKCSFKSWWKLM